MNSPEQLAESILEFLAKIGIEFRYGRVDGSTFLPGIDVSNGALVVDKDKLKYPTDLLHEAGHLAVITPEQRSVADGEIDVPDLDSVEAAAIAWSYAAAVHLGISLQDLFHEGGYLGQSQGFITTFSAGVYPGANELEERGLTKIKADAPDDVVYPQMVRWIS